MPFTEEQKLAYRKVLAPNASDEQWSYFIIEAERRNLIPGVHVIFQVRNAEEFSKELQRKISVQKVTLVTTINALRLIAERSGKFQGYGKFTYYYATETGEPTITSIIPFGRTPHAVSVELFRAGWQQPLFAVARYEACVQLKGDKTPTSMWIKRGEEQLAKCAEAAGLRMVAPEECGGLYIEEEMGNVENDSIKEIAPPSLPVVEAAPVVIPQATVAPAVNQAPAVVEPARPVLPQTSPFAEVAQATAWPEQPKAPSTPAPPKPPATPARLIPPTPKPVQTPVAAPAPTTPAPNPVPNRQPIAQGEPRETVTELAEFADRVARDTTPPAVPNAHGVVVTDDDLPENLQPPKPTAVDSPDGGKAIAHAMLAPSAATPEQYTKFMNRAAKIVRDKLEKEAKVKEPGKLVKEYLVRESGQKNLHLIPATKFEEMISALEKATAADAVKLVEPKEKK
jgi:hypothetical protein